jgi:serine/threonine-protein phosphatase 4 regulatory subunit 1
VVDYDPGEGTEDPALLPVQTFTPILGTLLLSPNPTVATSARRAVVDMLSEIRKASEGELESGLFGEEERRLLRDELLESVVIGMARLDMPDRPSSSHGDSDNRTQPQQHHQSNPYFPDVPSPSSPTSPRSNVGDLVTNAASQSIPTTTITDTDAGASGESSARAGSSPPDIRMTPSEDPEDMSEQAAMGRLSSMSLMAAITASGTKAIHVLIDVDLTIR